MQIQQTRDRFAENPDLVGQYSTLAEAVLDDVDAGGRSVSFSLESITSLVCRQKTARARLGESEYASLVAGGYLKSVMLEENERIVIAQIPELLVATLPIVMAARLKQELNDSVEVATRNLATRCGRLSAGDLIGAQAILEAAAAQGGLPTDVIRFLLESPPRMEEFKPGTKAVTFLDNKVRIELEFGEDGTLYMIAPDGSRFAVELEEDNRRLMSDITSWQILSHVASVELAAVPKGETPPIGLMSPDILVQVGCCEHPLRPVPPEGVDNALQHDLPAGISVICHKEGIIEPITFAIMRAMSGEREKAEYIIDYATREKNLPLMARLHIALLEVSRIANKERAGWAKKTIANTMRPALQEYGLIHA